MAERWTDEKVQRTFAEWLDCIQRDAKKLDFIQFETLKCRMQAYDERYGKKAFNRRLVSMGLATMNGDCLIPTEKANALPIVRGHIWSYQGNPNPPLRACKCDPLKCNVDDKGVKNILQSEGRCAWPDCKLKGTPPSGAYANWMWARCMCDPKLPSHAHTAPVFLCTTRCERNWKASDLNVALTDGCRHPGKDTCNDCKKGPWLRVQCHGCDKEEPDTKAFQKCSKCMRVAYCSRECQKTDWPTHKHSCRPALPTVCEGCQAQQRRMTFQACSRCRRVVYCSKECQRSHWPTHRQICS